jgi:ribosomal protein L21
MDIPKIYEKTNQYDDIVEINCLLNNKTNKKIYTNDQLDELELLITKFGLKKPVEVPLKYKNKEHKKIKSGHRRKATLIRMGVDLVPIKYVPDEDIEHEYDDAVNLMLENHGRDQDNFDKFKHVEQLNKMYKNKVKKGLEFNPLTEEKITEHCAIAKISKDLYDKCIEVRTARPELYKDITKGSKTIYGAWNEMKKKKEKAKNNYLSPQTKTVITSDVVKKALSMAQNAMRQFMNINVIGPDGKKWECMRGIQPNIISGNLHEIFTKAIGKILNFKGIKTLTLNNNLADIECPNENIQLETKTTKKITPIAWTGSGAVKGSYYLLIGFNKTFTRFYTCLAEVPYEGWVKLSQKNIKTLSMDYVYELKQKGKVTEFIGALEHDGDKVECFIDELNLNEYK